MFFSPSPKASGLVTNQACIEEVVRSVAAAALAARCRRGEGSRIFAELLSATVLVAWLNERLGGKLAIRSKRGDGRRKQRRPVIPENTLITPPWGDDVPETWLVYILEAVSNLTRSGRPPRGAMLVAALTASGGIGKFDARLRADTLALPPGLPVKLAPDAPASVVVADLCRAFGVRPSQIEVSILRRPWTEDRAREFEAAGAVVSRIQNGSFESMIRAVSPVAAGAPVRIAAGIGGSVQVAQAAVHAKATGGQLALQQVAEGGEMTGARVGPVLDADGLVKTTDAILVVAGCVSPPDGSGLFPGVRYSPATGRAWVSVLVSSPALGPDPVHYVVAFSDGHCTGLSALEPGQTLDAFLLADFLARCGKLHGYIQERGDEPDIEYLPYSLPLVPGFEGLSERALLAAFNTAAAGGWIEKDTETCGIDGTLSRVVWYAS